ncbi:class I SAM-dependent RNA methyltransferase [bacterium]|nr:class I SAM-dependent RNA methyltransferase [bacterium]
MERFSGKVFDLSQDGMGVVKSPEGVVFFVRGAWPGDEGVFVVTERKKKNYGFARIEKLEVESQDRVMPGCVYHGEGAGKCGGCPWQFVNYSAQVQWKQKLLNLALKRAGHENFLSRVESVVECSTPLGYRNRALMKSDGDDIGFLGFKSHELVPIDDCLVLNEANRATLKKLIGFLPHAGWRPQTGRKWRSIEFDDQMTAAEVMPDKPLEFRQVNDEQNNNMKRWLSQELEELPLESGVLELFCGNGNYTEVFSLRGYEKLVGIELSRSSIESAALKFPQYDFHALNLFERSEWTGVLRKVSDLDVLFLDPPREGFPQLPDLVAQMPALKTIYYVSCNYSTFFRDIAPLAGSAWELERLQPFDMFPQTPHLEIIGKFNLK